MRTRPVCATLIPIALLMAACGDETAPSAEITLETEDWNGWDPNHEPIVSTETYTVSEGDVIAFEPTFGGPSNATVESIDGDLVTLSLDAELVPVEDGRIMMRDYVSEATVTEGSQTELATPTMDGGMFYTFTVDVTS